MLVNLLDIWVNGLEQKKQAKDKKIALSLAANPTYTPSIDDKFMQSSFEFDSDVCVVFIDSSKGLDPVKFYDDLPTLSMNTAEQSAVNDRIETLRKNPKFYDGNQLLIKNVFYDAEAKVVYLDAIKAKYSFLNTLQSKRFPEDSALYQLKLCKTGVIAPFVTQDDYVFLMERNDPFKLYSAASGFLEASGEEKALMTADRDLVVYTAYHEALEEFLENTRTKASRVEFEAPNISSISFRETEGGMATVEFIAPIKVKCRKERLQKILSHNKAKDRHEHTGNFKAVPLEPVERNTAIRFLEQNNPGGFLYDPILLTTSRVVNSQYYHYRDFIPSHLPRSRTQAMPISAWSPKIHAPLLTWQWSDARQALPPSLQEENAAQAAPLTRRRILPKS